MSAPARRSRRGFDWPVAVAAWLAFYGLAWIAHYAWPIDHELAIGLVLVGVGLVMLLAFGARR